MVATVSYPESPVRINYIFIKIQEKVKITGAPYGAPSLFCYECISGNLWILSLLTPGKYGKSDCLD